MHRRARNGTERYVFATLGDFDVIRHGGVEAESGTMGTRGSGPLGQASSGGGGDPIDVWIADDEADTRRFQSR